MRQHWRPLGLIGAALALWLVPAILSTIGGPTRIALTSDPPPTPSTKRISAAGVHYGDCDGIALTVLLYPEPCEWDRARRRRIVASR